MWVGSGRWVGAEGQQKKQKQWQQCHARAMEEHSWMVWLLMEVLFVSAIPALEALIALNFQLLVLQMLTGMYTEIFLRLGF